MAANIITQFVLKQLGKKSLRKTGIATLNQGLTPTEQALLGPEEQAIRLRQRGMA